MIEVPYPGDGFQIKMYKPLGGLDCGRIKIKSSEGALGFTAGKEYSMIDPGNPYRCYIISDIIKPIYYCTLRIVDFNMHTIMHEFMNFLGFVHTHQIDSPSNELVFNKGNLRKFLKRNNQGCSNFIIEQIMEYQYFYREANSPASVYSQYSVMNYEFNQCVLKKGIATKNYYGLSPSDILGLRFNYGGGYKNTIEHYHNYKINNTTKFLLIILYSLSFILIVIFSL
jgi:hypothetical protein